MFLGLSETPPATPWGINFGGGLNSTALIIEAKRRGLNPDWILFADTGSEIPGTLEHVALMKKWCEGWCDIVTVRWIRRTGIFEPLHENCLRTKYLPSKAYGYSGCTVKWKIQPMDRWRKKHNYQRGSYAVGYDAGETKRIKKAEKKGDDIGFIAWYPLVAWNIDRNKCADIVASENIVVGKSSCFVCPNMRLNEWIYLKENHNECYKLALQIEQNAFENGNARQGGLIRKCLAEEMGEDDRCAYCYT